MTVPAVILDLESVLTLTGEAIGTIRGLNGARVTISNNNPRADVKRDLIYLADTLDRAAAEARAAYHVLNGRFDPLRSEA